ncbi:AbrB/MazE/SpoVT family DNA-binding domain-containing protein [Pseudomonas putida]|uniref:AbrB/MazE/SpoVT family DNA-binding domain-containing protein n=1 Tax=Pseudomonas putida TaxID=303 RepID=UPI002DBD15BC|nr:AbrB/MazE/SpoVT family DNA-binding domain-containing protein [Pseudomonas putida]WRW03806.1 AbrB/MazE/SpoVT family DNA-binding domain-containing protein [Pseudomonas putida]
MIQPLRMTVKCQDPEDGSKDVIIDLPPEILKALGVTVGDQLSIEIIEGVIVLKPVREATPR